MKIVHFGKYYPPDRGGIESVTASLARGAAAQGHDVIAVCFGNGDTGIQDGVQVNRHRATAVIASQPFNLGYVLDAVRQARNASIVHLHAPNMLAAWAALHIRRTTSVVVHWHSDVIDKGFLGQLLAPLQTALLRRADAIVCTSPPYAAASPALQPFASKVRVIPIGVSTPPAEASSPEAVPIGLREWIGTRPLVLCIGRLVPYKGYGSLVEAAAQVYRDAAIVIVGSGPLAEELQAKITQMGLDHRIRLAGRLEDDALARLREQAVIFCMPSIERSEAFGVSIIEAMAVGRAVLATTIPGSGVPWVNLNGVSGLNVPPEQPLKLAEAINLLLSDKTLLDRLAKGARQRYQEMFTEETSVQSTLALYQELQSANAAKNLAAGS